VLAVQREVQVGDVLPQRPAGPPALAQPLTVAPQQVEPIDRVSGQAGDERRHAEQQHRLRAVVGHPGVDLAGADAVGGPEPGLHRQAGLGVALVDAQLVPRSGPGLLAAGEGQPRAEGGLGEAVRDPGPARPRHQHLHQRLAGVRRRLTTAERQGTHGDRPVRCHVQHQAQRRVSP
jgi:hypothetical protein